jgi:hypothetical protein
MARRKRRRKKEKNFLPGTMASMLTLIGIAMLWLWLNDNYIHLDLNGAAKRQWWEIPLLVAAGTSMTAGSFISGTIIQWAYDRTQPQQEGNSAATKTV